MAKKPTKKAGVSVTPMKFVGDLWAARISMALAAAIDLDVFTIIDRGKKTAADIAKAAQASQRHMQRLLEALVRVRCSRRRDLSLVCRPWRIRSWFVGSTHS